MKRDMDLIRKLLFHFEQRDSFAVEEETKIEGYDDRLVGYHIRLIAQAGLIDCEIIRSSSTPERIITALPFSLSWAGHEFLDAARDENLWNKAKNKTLKATGGVGLDMVKEVLKYYAKQALGLEIV